jgi:hypothetical protein
LVLDSWWVWFLAYNHTRREVPHPLKKGKKTQEQCHLQLEHINVDNVEKGRKKEKNVNCHITCILFEMHTFENEISKSKLWVIRLWMTMGLSTFLTSSFWPTCCIS